MAMTLLATNPDSTDVASVSFTSGIDSTYKLYIFKFININPATDGTEKFQVNFSTDGGSNYNMTKTTSVFDAQHAEDNSSATLSYEAGWDLAQSTGAQWLMTDMGNGADESGSGELFLFNPSNTTYVKHFYARTQYYRYTDQSQAQFTAGFVNSTSDIDAVQFTMTSGNFDGTIKLYGVG